MKNDEILATLVANYVRANEQLLSAYCSHRHDGRFRSAQEYITPPMFRLVQLDHIWPTCSLTHQWFAAADIICEAMSLYNVNCNQFADGEIKIYCSLSKGSSTCVLKCNHGCIDENSALKLKKNVSENVSSIRQYNKTTLLCTKRGCYNNTDA